MKLQSLIALSLLVAGCGQSDDSICGSGLAVEPPIQTEPKDVIYRRQVAFACVERWAARLSRGSEAVPVVAEAVLGSCEDSIAFYQEERAKALKQQLAPPSEYERSWRRRAVFIATQARAGGCYKDA